MSEKILNILIVEDDTFACQELRHSIEKVEYLKLVGITGNADKGIDMVKTLLPDVIILDIELHHGSGNGILFLSKLNTLQLTRRPYILITTNNSSHITYETVRQLGADFIMNKYKQDYSAQYVIEFITMIQHALFHRQQNFPAALPEEDNVEQKLSFYTRRIYRELDLIGISPKNIGYRYLADAILLILKDTSANVYKELASSHKKSDASIERAMQNAINRAWRISDIEELLTHYTAKIHSEKGVPSTLEFIYYYANKIRMDI